MEYAKCAGGAASRSSGISILVGPVKDKWRGTNLSTSSNHIAAVDSLPYMYSLTQLNSPCSQVLHLSRTYLTLRAIAAIVIGTLTNYLEPAGVAKADNFWIVKVSDNYQTCFDDGKGSQSVGHC